MICKSCGCNLPDNAVFCLECGVKQDTKIYCPSCNTELPAEARFCLECGATIGQKNDKSSSALDINQILEAFDSSNKNASSNENIADCSENNADECENRYLDYQDGKLVDECGTEYIDYIDTVNKINLNDKVILILESIDSSSNIEKVKSELEFTSLEDDEINKILEDIKIGPIILFEDITWTNAEILEDSLRDLGCKLSKKVKKEK